MYTPAKLNSTCKRSFYTIHQKSPLWRNKPNSDHEDVIKWKHFSLYWPFVRGIHRSLVDFPRKGLSGGALMFSSIYAWENGWANNRDTRDLRHYRAHYDVNVMHLDNIASRVGSRFVCCSRFGYHENQGSSPDANIQYIACIRTISTLIDW